MTHAQTRTDVGIVADFLFQGGAEMVIDLMAETFPQARLYSDVHDPATISLYPSIARARTEGRLALGWADRILSTRLFRWAATKGVTFYHYYWLYFLTAAFERTQAHEVVLVSCAAQAKLVRLPRGARVIVYFHTPSRWLYPELVTAADLASIPFPLRAMIGMLACVLRPLDRLGMKRLQRHDPVWLCNSQYVRSKLRAIYGIDAAVLHPPVDVTRFSPHDRAPEDFFLYHGRITLQKRLDLCIDACLMAKRRLVISGQAVSVGLERQLKERVARAEARDPGLRGLVTFHGRTDDSTLHGLFATCAALLFPQREDFGITPIEAMAAGVPVIAFRDGGALDYLRPQVNGVFFEEQTPGSLAEAIAHFDHASFDPTTVAASFGDLSRARFSRQIEAMVGR